MHWMIVIALVALLPDVGHAKRAPVYGTLALVQAQCEGPPPGPCSASFSFQSGTAILRGAKEPGPTCPKTGQPTDAAAGEIRLAGVTKDGASFSGSLAASVSLKTTFARDPNGNCSLAGVQIVTPSLNATLTCTNGKCRGTLLPIACLEKSCADAPVTTEFAGLVVQDDAGKDLARFGTVLVPQSSDAP